MISEEKQKIRKHIGVLKKQLREDQRVEKSISIFNKLEKLELFQKANVVLLYWSIRDEVFTHDFVNKWHKQKTILLPAVNGNTIDLKVYTGSDSLRKGMHFDIEEPVGNTFTAIDRIELAIVPGIAFDKQCQRMGRGKGYYDRFLSEYKGYTIGVCYDIQIIPYVPIEKHDIALNKLIFA